jgi:hypothetical protein
MSRSTSAFVSLRLRRRSMATLVRVGSQRRWVQLAEQPPVGAILDAGFPVRVTAAKQVAGGGLLIDAEPAEAGDGA